MTDIHANKVREYLKTLPSLDWVEEIEGYECRILFNEGGGFFCGYIRIPKGHRILEDRYHYLDRVSWSDFGMLDVHGGITFAEHFEEWTAGFPPGTWVGFDCGHHGDFALGGFSFGAEVFRDVDYVRDELESLANQLDTYTP